MVNPGILPTTDDQFYYKATGSLGKRIIVEKEDLQGMQLKDSNLYIKVSCQHACRYILETMISPNGILDLRPGFSESGVLRAGSYRQHLVTNRHFTGTKLSRDYTIKLQLYSGEANL